MDDNLAQDLVAMWQSELTAMAADREVREAWAAMVALWAQSAAAAMKLVAYDKAPGSAGAAQPARAAPAAAAPQPGVDEIERLGRRVAELEQRLAQLLERGDGGAGPGKGEGGV
jgi:Lon protease-like protein